MTTALGTCHVHKTRPRMPALVIPAEAGIQTGRGGGHGHA